jgi:asparagine synthase (glutamine-hydrolysing)
MCGIAGFTSRKWSEEDLRRANDCLQHRGPDAAGVYYKDGVGLGHRRLSIQDLSEAGSQPMYSHDGRYVIIYNGEVYNGAELRERLPGTRWRGHSDTEVILELFVKWGPECFGWLNGMFAMAIWDQQERQLTLARDPIGIKPLFWYIDESSFAFSSELKAIKSLQPKLSLNEDAIPYFLHLSYIPAPMSIYREVMKFPSGQYVAVDFSEGEPRMGEFQTFWSVEARVKKEVLTDKTSAEKELRDILFRAVERQLISDVPFGTFLSGGIDSTVVTAVASRVSSSKLNTFSIAMVDGKVNEAPYAASIAKYLDTNHHELPIRERDMIEMIPDLLNVYDEPFGDASAFPTMLVSKLAREHVTVALSGDGGDEQFMGYGTYLWAERMNNPLLRLLRKPLHLASAMTPEYYRHAAKMLDYPSKVGIKSHIYSQDYFSDGELKGMMKKGKVSFEGLNSALRTDRVLSAKEEQSFWDLKYYLQDDLLVKVDRASMKYSLETRVPLLDLELVAWSLNLSEDLKMRKRTHKYLLKQVLYDLVPSEYFDRPKWGFGIPLEKALRNELQPLVEQYFNREVIERYGIIDASKAMSIKSKFVAGSSMPHFQVWLITLLHWWLEKNV